MIFFHFELYKKSRGAWVLQSVDCLTLGLSLGLDLRLLSSSPAMGYTLGLVPTLSK